MYLDETELKHAKSQTFEVTCSHACDPAARISDWLPLAQTRPHPSLHAVLFCSAIGWAQMVAAHGGELPLPLQLPGERGLLLSFIVCLGDGVWISLFSPSHFDLTPVRDS